ncbi:DUF3592 domain-containing protein [Lentzea rhizosphaerae]|uniref:DUF3592 domain-containing protein n=1 Tax=Lentzea rhizosphaerae TaxID=2041025 RepID=A0ABV8C157_9PSEU
MREAGVEDVRRLRLRTVCVRGMDDLTRPGSYSVPEPVATVAVRRLRRRGRAMALIGLLLFAGFVVGANLLVDRADALLATGEPTPGVVVGVHPGLRGAAGTIDVRFTVAGVERTRSMNLDDSSPALEAGDPITVFYDRDDPERIAAPGVSNAPFLPNLLTVVAFVLSATLLPPGVIGLVRWGRRVRAVRLHGWRRGQAETDGNRIHRIRFHRNGPGLGPVDGGSTDSRDHAMTVVTTSPVAHEIPPEFRTGEVLVGGRGRHLALMFTRGPVLAAAWEVHQTAHVQPPEHLLTEVSE